jgi:hypothetical protein
MGEIGNAMYIMLAKRTIMSIKAFGLIVFLLLWQLSNAIASEHPSKTEPLVLSADFTDQNEHVGEVFDFFDVSVRTQNASANSIPAKFGRRAKVNTVRMLGGFFNRDVEADTYKWNGKEYVYDFAQATKRIDTWLEKDWDIFQIVLDNPPWAFQRGYKFVAKANGKDYLQEDARGVYGNVLPPNDPIAWNNYISAFIQHLIDTYGKETVMSWRFRIGSEIDTRPQHWAATRQEFFEHYKNTVEAVHSVLPNVKVGVQFREASFKGRYVDYTSNTEDAYAPHFIKWAKANNIHYDFVAISYYPHIHKSKELNMEHVYEHDMAPIKEHPDWNLDASFEIHEFKLISKMQRAGFVSVSTSHSSAFFAMLSKLVLEKKVSEIFQWGNARNGDYISEAMTQLALHSMLGNQIFRSHVLGESKIAGNNINGIFTQTPDKAGFDILLFNFNADDLSYQASEHVNIVLNVDIPMESEILYRVANIDASNNHIDMFYAQFAEKLTLETEGGWLIHDIHPTAAPNKRLNQAGQNAFKKAKKAYGKSNQLQWNERHRVSIKKSELGQTQLIIPSQITSFGVQRIEVRQADRH